MNDANITIHAAGPGHLCSDPQASLNTVHTWPWKPPRHAQGPGPVNRSRSRVCRGKGFVDYRGRRATLALDLHSKNSLISN